MRSPQLEDGYLCLAHELDAAIAAAGFGKCEGIVLREIRAAIYGPAKLREVGMSPTEISKRWGLTRSQVSTAFNNLLKRNVLVRTGQKSVRFNKLYESWKDNQGETLFNPQMVKEISLAVARAVAHCFGGWMPPSMLAKVLGPDAAAATPQACQPTFQFKEPTPEPKAEARSVTPKPEPVKTPGVPQTERAAPEESNGPRLRSGTVETLYRTHANSEKEKTKEKEKNPPSPLPQEPTFRPLELPPGSNHVLAIANDRWGMNYGEAKLDRDVSDLLKEYQNAALVKYALDQWWTVKSGDGKRKFALSYVKVICEENKAKYAGTPPPSSARPKDPPKRAVGVREYYPRDEDVPPSRRGIPLMTYFA